MGGRKPAGAPMEVCQRPGREQVKESLWEETSGAGIARMRPPGTPVMTAETPVITGAWWVSLGRHRSPTKRRRAVDAGHGCRGTLRSMNADVTPDEVVATPVTRWETYAEIAARFGITPEAARAHAKRQRWKRRPRSNSDPFAPAQFEVPPDWIPQRTGAARDGMQGVMTGMQGVMAGMHGVATEMAEVKSILAVLLAEQTARADRAEQGREAAQAALRQAQEALEQLRAADQARRSQGRLARLRAAWRGW